MRCAVFLTAVDAVRWQELFEPVLMGQKPWNNLEKR